MGQETILFKSKEKKTSREIVDILRQIADKVASGSVTLKQGTNEVNVNFPQAMELQLKVEEEQGRRLKKKFEIELEWVVGDDSSAPGGSTAIL